MVKFWAPSYNGKVSAKETKYSVDSLNHSVITVELPNLAW